MLTHFSFDAIKTDGLLRRGCVRRKVSLGIREVGMRGRRVKLGIFSSRELESGSHVCNPRVNEPWS